MNNLTKAFMNTVEKTGDGEKLRKASKVNKDFSSVMFSKSFYKQLKKIK